MLSCSEVMGDGQIDLDFVGVLSPSAILRGNKIKYHKLLAIMQYLCQGKNHKFMVWFDLLAAFVH